MDLQEAFQSSDRPGEALLNVYKNMVRARLIDKYEDQYTSSGAAFFHVSGAGHEGTAALGEFLIPEDYLHLHYRDKALMLSRGITTEMFFHSLFCKDQSHSRGRQMSAHLSNRELNVMSLVGPVGNNALQAAGAAHVLKKRNPGALVVCSMGEGTTQEGEVLESMAEAVRAQLPVLFLVQDNSYAISTLTDGNTFYCTPKGEHDEFYSMPITRVDGKYIEQSYDTFGKVTSEIRQGSGPQVVVFKAERLSSHSNADDHKIYRSQDDIQAIKDKADPIAIAEKLLNETYGYSNFEEIKKVTETEVKAAADKSIRSPEPEPCFTALKPLEERFYSSESEYRGNAEKKELTMLEGMREVLRHWLEKDERVSLYGEDLEDPKGDVFGVTKTLSTQFPGRVINSALSESTIVGISAGKALAGEKPIAFLQFADFLPIALNQIITEIATMFWRTDGSWQCPMVIMITCGGYRPGLGPFHAQTFEALATHTPGIDVFMPSTAGDAAGLLNTAMESERPTLLFYPKSCLNETENATSKDVAKQFIPLAKARTIKTGKDITLIGWGNTVSRCIKAADALETTGLSAEVLDLRSLAPWDKETVLKSVRKTGKVIVAHEDNLTCGMGAEILAYISEHAGIAVKAARVTREDTYIPCNFSNQLDVLPSFKRILEKTCELLNCSIEWEKAPEPEQGVTFIEAMGTSPSDETITIHEWLIEEGDEIEEGQELALFEANKATAELLSQVEGEVLEILLEEGSTVNVGTPILKVKTDATDTIPKPVTFERPGTPHITRNFENAADKGIGKESSISITQPAISGISVVHGKKEIDNKVILEHFPDRDSSDIVQMTGIKKRNHIGEGQNLLSMATEAAKKVLEETGLKVEDLEAIICSTGTPDVVTPSLACRVLNNLTDNKSIMIQAHDINAACTGYIYGLQNAYDILSHKKNSNVLLITCEVLSPLLDQDDFSTAIIFGDAATATILTNVSGESGLRIGRPELSASGESGDILSVPVSKELGCVRMKGKKVFTQAVKQMSIMLEKACGSSNMTIKDLDLIIPHQANQRIIDAIITKNNLDPEKVFSNIENYGNTSSNTIPICLAELKDKISSNDKLGLCAIGGGFTFGAAVITAD